jgi:hypothetical protein
MVLWQIHFVPHRMVPDIYPGQSLLGDYDAIKSKVRLGFLALERCFCWNLNGKFRKFNQPTASFINLFLAKFRIFFGFMIDS